MTKYIKTDKPPVIITAVGRSGTTITDKLLTHILEDHEGRPRSIYEPFLWDHRKLLKYPEHGDQKRFNSFETISSEGIFYHTHFPLFIDEDYLSSNANQIYMEGFERYLFENRGDEEEQSEYPRYLMKFIRANGRLPLLSKMMPNGRYILLTRNPIDTFNSVINMFSFHGDEYHSSDYPRFQQSVKEYFNETLPNHDRVPIALKQAYWAYYQTIVALDYAIDDDRFLIIPYEGLLENSGKYIQQICSHIDLPFKENFLNILDKNSGKNNRRLINIHKDQVQIIMPLFKQYVDAMENRLGIKLDSKKIIEKYTHNPNWHTDIAWHQQYKPKLGHHAGIYFKMLYQDRIARKIKDD